MIAIDGPEAADYRRMYLEQQRAAAAAQAARDAAAATDASAANAAPAGKKFNNRPTEENKQAAIEAYKPVYENVQYELELAVDRGENLDTAAQNIKNRHKDDGIFGQVVDAAAAQVKNEGAAAR